MRYSRVLIVLGLVAAVGLSVGLLARASQNRSAKPLRAAIATPVRHRHEVAATPRWLRRTVQQELQRLIAPRSRIIQPSLGRVVPLSPGGQTCFVATGTCSETPCVIPVTGGSAPVVTAGPAVATVVTATPVPARGPPKAGAVAPTVTVPSAPGLAPGRSCPSRHAAPQTLRVSTP